MDTFFSVTRTWMAGLAVRLMSQGVISRQGQEARVQTRVTSHRAMIQGGCSQLFLSAVTFSLLRLARAWAQASFGSAVRPFYGM